MFCEKKENKDTIEYSIYTLSKYAWIVTEKKFCFSVKVLF